MPSAGPGGRREAVLFDALGTLVELEPPWPFLRVAASQRYGIDLDEAQAKAAMLGEMTYYKAHHMEGTDDAALQELRARCAGVLQEQLPPLAKLPREEVVELLLASLRFRPYPDAAPVLGYLRQLDVRTAVVSNWDTSLPRTLGELGLGGLVDDVVVSAAVGVPKPASEIFEHALRKLGSPPRRALMVGDSPETDVAGALAAGIPAALLDRSGTGTDMEGVERIFTLESLPQLVSPEPSTSP